MIADAARLVAERDYTVENARLRRDPSISVPMAALMEDQYRKFQILCLMYPEAGLTPSKAMDAFWHEHMADTRKYMADCQALAGGMMHHDPNIMGEDMERRFALMAELYMKEFGEDPRLAAMPFPSDDPASCGHAASCACIIPTDQSAGCGCSPAEAASCSH